MSLMSGLENIFRNGEGGKLTTHPSSENGGEVPEHSTFGISLVTIDRVRFPNIRRSGSRS